MQSCLGQRAFPSPTEPCKNVGVANYIAVIHEDPAGGYWAEVPALPGCYTQAESIDELKTNLRDAISGVLAVLKEQGEEPEANVRVLDIAV